MCGHADLGMCSLPLLKAIARCAGGDGVESISGSTEQWRGGVGTKEGMSFCGGGSVQVREGELKR